MNQKKFINGHKINQNMDILDYINITKIEPEIHLALQKHVWITIYKQVSKQIKKVCSFFVTYSVTCANNIYIKN